MQRRFNRDMKTDDQSTSNTISKINRIGLRGNRYKIFRELEGFHQAKTFWRQSRMNWLERVSLSESYQRLQNQIRTDGILK